MSFEIHERDLAGRIGILKTKTAPIETPALFPVYNHVKKTVRARTITKIGFQQIIANAYLISKHSKRAAMRKGIHKFLGFQGTIMTDSGAYQILSHGHVDVDPSDIIAFQEAIDTDIAVILDIPTASGASRESAEESVETTVERAKQSVKQRKRRDILWSGPIQGGNHLDLVERSAKAMAKLPFDIYAIGSPTTIMEQYQYPALVDLVMTARQNLPLQAPVHLFGAGHPAMFGLAVAMGCDLFDSAAYAIYARDGRYLTPDGTLHLDELSHLPCECPVCVRTNATEFTALDKKEKERNLAEHNLYASIREIKQIKSAVKRGVLWEHIRTRCMSHPKLWEGFLQFKEFSRHIEPFDPLPAPDQAGITFTGSYDLARPEVNRHHSRLLREYSPPEGRGILLLIPEVDLRRTGFPKHLEHDVADMPPSEVHVCMYSHALGIIPAELAETFPLAQHAASGLHQHEVEENLVESILSYVKENFEHYRDVIVIQDESQFSDEFYSELASGLREAGFDTK